jgi:preprotein translocase subunit SecB
MAENTTTEGQQPAAGFNLIRVYVKDVSFEAPNTPEIFQQQFEPAYNVGVTSKARKLDGEVYEVVLTVNVEAKSGEKVAFLAEVQQAGLMHIAGIDGMPLRHALSAFCPTILFPYARQIIANLIGEGGFPALHLNPINFDQLFALQLQKEAEQAQPASDSLQ